MTFVCVDRDLDLCVAGGVEILGLHATVAPRRHQQTNPVLEQYCFVPYICDNNDDDLNEYFCDCSAFAAQKLKGLCNNEQSGSKFERIRNFCCQMECYNCKKNSMNVSQHSHSALYTYLESVFSNFDHEIQMSSSEEILNSISLMCNPQILKPCLDIVMENMLSQSIKIVEMGARKSHMHHKITPLVSSQPMMSLSYISCDQPGANSGQDEGLEVTDWDLGKDPPSNVKNVDVLVVKNFLCRQANISDTLKILSSALKENGFLLVEEVTRNFPAAFALDKVWEEDLKQEDERSCFCYCDELRWCKIFEKAGFNVIFKRSNGMSTVFLIRPKTRKDVPSWSIIPVDDLTGAWFDEMKQKVISNQEKNLWLVVKSEPKSGILGMFNCLKQEPGGDKLRYVVVM